MESGAACGKPPTSAMPVDPDRISLPTVAGTVDPNQFLSVERQAVLNSLDSLVMPTGRWPSPVPRGCHMVDRQHEAKLNQILLDSGMAALVDESFVPRDRNNRKILACLFSVPRKPHSDRLIFDRRAGKRQSIDLTGVGFRLEACLRSCG